MKELSPLVTEIRYKRVISLGKAYRSNGSNLTGILILWKTEITEILLKVDVKHHKPTISLCESQSSDASNKIMP